MSGIQSMHCVLSTRSPVRATISGSKALLIRTISSKNGLPTLPVK